MLAVQPGTEFSSSGTLFDIWIVGPASGLLTDPATIQFQIWDLTAAAPALVLPDPDDEDVWEDATKIATGHYCIETTVPGDTENLGRYEVRWRWQMVAAGVWSRIRRPFDVLAAVWIDSGDWLCLPSDLVDEGYTLAEVAGRRGQEIIRLVSEQIRQWTGRRSFEPMAGPIYQIGKGTRDLMLEEPIVGISEINAAIITGGEEELFEVDTDYVTIHNRHVRMGGGQYLVDREVPLLQRYSDGNDEDLWEDGGNYRVDGVFGFVDPEPTVSGSPGVISHAARRAAMLMVIRELPQQKYFDEVEDRKVRWKVSSESHGGHSVGLASQQEGKFTGDPEIDRLLVEICRPFGGGRS